MKKIVFLILCFAICNMFSEAVYAEESTPSVSYSENSSITLFDNPTTYGSQTSYYRIPAITRMKDGTLVSFCDLRIGNSGDVGGGNPISIVAKKSTDNGATWGTQITAVTCNSSSTGFDYAHGDAAVVTDRETDKMLILAASGKTAYSTGGVLLGRYYSTDGTTWTGGEITSDIKTAFSAAGLSVSKQFFTSGRIIQSSKIKIGSSYRIYSAMCTSNGSIVMYSDDFGSNWAVLGGKVAYSGGDETVLEELPNGDILLSARLSGSGRGFNVFNYSDLSTGTGSWSTTTSTGISDATNCNGEMLLSPTANPNYYVLLHSVSLSGRNNVTVYYKLINTEADKYTSSTYYSSGWNVLHKMSSTTSAYSTMVSDKDGNVAFLMEENNVADTKNNASYDIKYVNFKVNVTGLPESPKKYYIYNVSKKQYLSVSGNIVSLAKTGTPFTFTKSNTTGDYTLTADDGTTLSTSFLGDIICSNDGYYTLWKLSPVSVTDNIFNFAILEDEDAYAYSYIYYSDAIGGISKSAAKTTLVSGQWKILKEMSAPVDPDPEPVTEISLHDTDSMYTRPENMAEKVDVYLYRTLVAGKKSSFCVPFDMTSEQLAEAFGDDYSLYGYSIYNSTSNKVYFSQEDEVTAGQPYVIVPEISATEYIIKDVPSDSFVSSAKSVIHGDYTFYGVFTDNTLSDYYTYDDDSGIMKYASADRELKGFRAYFKANSNNAKALTAMCFDDVTGINDVSDSKSQVSGAARYNLLGQKVNADAKGIMIIDGKKTVK